MKLRMVFCRWIERESYFILMIVSLIIWWEISFVDCWVLMLSKKCVWFYFYFFKEFYNVKCKDLLDLNLKVFFSIKLDILMD